MGCVCLQQVECLLLLLKGNIFQLLVGIGYFMAVLNYLSPGDI